MSKINGDDCLGDAYDVVVVKLKTAPRPMMVHFLGMFAPVERDSDEGGGGGGGGAAAAAASGGAGSAAAVAGPAPAPAPVLAAAAPAPAAPAPVADERAVTGLIGEGISYVGTGATPRPGAAARTGLAHHAMAEAARADDAAAGASFGGLL